jgi:hypothetical protein
MVVFLVQVVGAFEPSVELGDAFAGEPLRGHFDTVGRLRRETGFGDDTAGLVAPALVGRGSRSCQHQTDKWVRGRQAMRRPQAIA